MSHIFKLILLSSLALTSSFSYGLDGLWNATKKVSKNIAQGVGDTTSKVGGTISSAASDEKQTPQQQQKIIDSNADKALARLFKDSKHAKKVFDSSVGYAVFDSREFAFLIKTGFGSGVAVDIKTKHRTYMKMASGGLNLGGGIKYMQVIFLFPTQQTLNHFIKEGWSGESDASAIGGSEGGNVGLRLTNGTSVYQLTDTGIMLKMSISGTKYWTNSELN
jgi:lipid-binding SYLF domain-containing protein